MRTIMSNLRTNMGFSSYVNSYRLVVRILTD